MSLQAQVGLLAAAALCHGTILTCAVWALWGDAAGKDAEVADLVDRLASSERRLASLEAEMVDDRDTLADGFRRIGGPWGRLADLIDGGPADDD